MTRQNNNTVNKSKARDMLKELKEAKNAASAAKEAKETLQMENKILKQNVQELEMKLFERDAANGEESLEENEDQSSIDGRAEGNDSLADTGPTAVECRGEEGAETLTFQQCQPISAEMHSEERQKQECDTSTVAGMGEQLDELEGMTLKKQEGMCPSIREGSPEKLLETPENLVHTTTFGIATPLTGGATEERVSAQHIGIDTNKEYNQSDKEAKLKRDSNGKIVAFGSGFAAGVTISLLRALATGLRRRN